MKKIITLLLLLSFFGLTYGKEVDENTAKKVGKAFLISKANSQIFKGTITLQLVYKANSKIIDSSTTIRTTTFFYVFNIDSTGFVIVAGDDNVVPILGYSDQGIFKPNNIPQNVAKWLEGYKSQICYIIDKNIQATNQILLEWQNLKTETNLNSAARITTNVNPLVQSHWAQNPYYNALCPYDNASSQLTVTGCVATAMAQIMKYWNYPASGSGFHSYNHPNYGTLSANFGSTTYQWGSMTNVVNSSNSAVATLMYQVGVSVDMRYGIASTGGSAAQTLDVANALKTYFNYDVSVQGISRINYSDIQWKAVLKAELDARRPVQYAGTGSGGGHSFVCDGYDNNDMFHFNWGWGGSSDGYFSIDALNPGGVGTGGGTGGFNTNHRAIIGIKPPAGIQTYNLGLYNYVTPSTSTVSYGQPFSITTNIANYGANTYNGDYTAAIFDNSYNFIDYVQTLTGYTLQGGYAYTNNLVFSTTGLFSMLPGTYYVGIFYRPTGGNWIQVSNSGNYSNLVQMTVINPNDIEINSAMIVTPGLTLTQGQSVSVNLNIVNDGANTFVGQYHAGLYNLDGTFAQTIGTISENNGLPSGYTYVAPYLTFSTSSVTATPGTYLLAVQHNPNNTGWQLTGSSYHLNPIKVNVVAANLQPDIYEVNNTVGQSYNLPITSSGNNATANTQGSNSHVGTDNDYYKINLPVGYNYTISARLHDSYNSGNGNTYSLDALFSYSTDGVNWSGAYDDIMPSGIVMSGGHTIYFHVAPYFAGGTGTYLLDIQLTKSPYQFVWTGITSSDWSNGSNWSTGTVPTAIDDIIIPSGTPFSAIINNGIVGVCKSIHINNGAKVTVSTGGNLRTGM